MTLTVLTKVSFLQEIPSQPLVNYQKHEITFHPAPDGSVTCNLSKKGVLVAKNIPLIIDTHCTPPLSSRTVTYYPSQNLVVWGSCGLKGGMGPGTPKRSTIEVSGDVENKGTGVQVVGDSFHVGGDFRTGDIHKYTGLTPSQILQLKEKERLDPLAKNPTENLPEPQYDFVGREELLISLAKCLIPVQYQPQAPSTIRILQGPPGIGKTELAITFANRHAASFCKIWLIHAETSLESDYQNLAKSLHLSIEPNEPIAEVQTKVHRILQELAVYTKKPYLLLFDNVENPFKLTTRGGRLLLTTRNRAIYEDQAVYQEVKPFTLDDTKVLYKRRFNSQPPRELEELLQKSEGFPFIIRAIFGTTDHPEGFKAIFEESKSQQTLQEHKDSRYQEKPGAVFTTLLKKFESQNQEAYQLLQVLSCFSPDTIPLSLIDLYGTSRGFTTQYIWALTGALTDYIARYTDKTKTALAIHRITQTTCKTLQSDDKPYTQALALLKEFVEGFDQDKLDTWHIGQTCATHYPFVRESPHWENGDSNSKWLLLNRLGRYWKTVGKYGMALTVEEEALELIIKIHEENHSDVAESYYNIGITLDKLGRYAEALEAKKKALELLGENDLAVASTYNNMGATLNALGRHAEALEVYKKALELQIKLLGEKHLDIASSYYNMGMAFGDLGRHTEALEAKKKALELLIEFLGENHPDVASSYNNIGATLNALGRHAEALVFFKKALELRKGLFEENHPAIASSYNNIGVTLGDLGRHIEALEAKKKGLELLIELLGENHPDVAESYYNIGITLGNLRRHAEAVQAYKKALELRKAFFGEQHPYVTTLGEKIQRTTQQHRLHNIPMKEPKSLQINQDNTDEKAPLLKGLRAFEPQDAFEPQKEHDSKCPRCEYCQCNIQ